MNRMYAAVRTRDERLSLNRAFQSGRVDWNMTNLQIARNYDHTLRQVAERRRQAWAEHINAQPSPDYYDPKPQ